MFGNINNKAMILIKVLGALLVLAITSHTTVYIKYSAKESLDTLVSQKYLNIDYVSLIDFCDLVEAEWKWNRYSERLDVYLNANKISFIQNNTFYQIDDSLYQSLCSPIRLGGQIFHCASETARIFNRLDNYEVTWVDSNSLFTISHLGQVSSLVPKQKKKPTTKLIPKYKKVASAGKSDATVLNNEEDNNFNLSSTPYLKNTRQRIRTIVIDPGHGGKDPGAVGSRRVKEKDVVLAISKILFDTLKNDTTLNPILTRSTDVFIPLHKRTQFANDKNADLFISIHANSIGGNKKRKNNVKGYKVYFLSQEKNEEDKQAAMIENSVIKLEDNNNKKGTNNYLQNILNEMANNEFLTESQELSILIAESFGRTLKKVEALQKGVGQARFWVLNGAYMPSVLVETCFISNPDEEKMLTTKKFQRKIASGIYQAIKEFQRKYESGL